MKYPKLFTPGKIGRLTLPNRLVMPAMGTNMASYTGEASDQIIRYYEARARGGCGLIITEITRIDDGAGVGMPNQLSVTSPKYIPRLSQLADTVHRHGTKIFLQLHHPGRTASRASLGGLQCVAPSPIPEKSVGEMPHALTAEECRDLVGKFVRGAYFAQLAGMDGVELHAAHGYLINQFLSPYSNHRTDEYGGNETGRMRFLTEIVTGIRTLCGPSFPISVRLSCDEFVTGGLKLEDTVRMAQILEGLGVAAINVSAGVYASGWAIIEPQGLPEGWKKHLAKAVKAAVSIPVIAVNNIKYPATAERYLEEGVCDFAAVGRGQLADPEWGNKAMAGRDGAVRKCLGCMYCFQCLGRLRSVECTVNPVLGREGIYGQDTLKQDGAGRPAAVAGGGPGGMQAALVLARRGFRVTLFEREEALGGAVRLAALPPHKEMLAELVKTMEGELAQAGVEVRLGTEASVETIAALAPCGVIVATGGRPIVPDLPGISGRQVYTAEQVLSGDVELTGKRVAVIGGGTTGLETAEVLAGANTVTVVEQAAKAGTGLYVTVRKLLKARLAEAGATLRTGQRLAAVADGGVILEDAATGERQRLEADAVVLAMGVRPDRGLAEKLSAAGMRVACVGDAGRPGQVADAMKEANDRAWVF